MIIKRFTVGPLATNCYLAVCEQTGKSVVIDPGGISDDLLDAIRDTKLTAVLLTHGHFDHILGVPIIVGETGVPVQIHELDAHMLSDPVENGSFMIGAEITVPAASKTLTEGDIVTFGDSSLSVIYTPGHTPGGISFVDGDRSVLGGDTLFRMSVGRWDLPGGDYDTLMESLRLKFGALKDGVIVYPGHGEETTIGFERMYNQFMRQ